MGDFTQPQQNYSGTGENCNIEIAVILYSVDETFWNFLFILFGCVCTQIWNLRCQRKFWNIFKISRNLGSNPKFWNIKDIFAKFPLVLKLKIWVLTHPNNMHENVQGEKWQRLQYCRNSALYPRSYKDVQKGQFLDSYYELGVQHAVEKVGGCVWKGLKQCKIFLKSDSIHKI